MRSRFIERIDLFHDARSPGVYISRTNEDRGEHSGRFYGAPSDASLRRLSRLIRKLPGKVRVYSTGWAFSPSEAQSRPLRNDLRTMVRQRVLKFIDYQTGLTIEDVSAADVDTLTEREIGITEVEELIDDLMRLVRINRAEGGGA